MKNIYFIQDLKPFYFLSGQALIKVFGHIKHLFILLLIFSSFPAASQSVLNYNPPAPNVGSLLRVQDLSVNLYTGRPNINIPLYSIALNDFSYDIQLFYNAEGNKVDLPVGYVGLGWSITGGQIYRVANGFPDEVYTLSEYLDRTEMPDWNLESNLDKYHSILNHNHDLNQDYSHEPDLDEFRINIGDINATFYMYRDRTGHIKTKVSSQSSPYFEVKDIKTGGIPDFLLAEAEWTNSKLGTSYHPKLEATTLLNSIKEITIVDSKGITYIFGGDIESIDFSFVYMQDPEYPKYYNMYGKQIGQHNAAWDDFNSFMVGTPLTWHIKKIILPNKEDLKFSYSKSNINVMERFDHHAIVASRHTGERIYSTTNNPNNTLLPEGVDQRYLFQLDKKYDISYPSLLESIYVSNGDFIKFISSKRNDLTTHGVYFDNKIFLRDNYGGVLSNIEDRCYYYKLDKIEAKGGICEFYYTDKNEQRLKLDSLLIDKTEKYKFQYNPSPLPPHSRTLTDNWGYYNKKDYSQFVKNGFFNELYNVRKPDSTFVKAEILEKITYPTGGKVHLQYELHTYSKIATQYPFEIKQESGVAGGVRIKRITASNDEHPSDNIIKNYLYLNEDNTSSGILSVVPKYETNGSGRIDYDHGGISMHGEYNYSNVTLKK